MKKATINDMELGNMLFGYSRGKYPVDRKYADRFIVVLALAGYDSYGCEDSISDKFCNKFIVRPYWWGDDDAEEAWLPNFECPEIGLTMTWYKYPLRDSYSNIPFTNKIMKKLEQIVSDNNY